MKDSVSGTFNFASPRCFTVKLFRRWQWNLLSLVSILSLLLVAADARPVDPLGGQMADFFFQAEVNAGSSYTVSIKLDQLQVVSFLLEPVVPFRAGLTLRLGETILYSLAAESPGQPLLIQSVQVAPGGAQVYLVEVSAPDAAPPGTSYPFHLKVITSALEEEPYLGISNDTIDNAQPLNNGKALIEIANKVVRGGVSGRLADENDQDIYSFSADVGDHIEVVMTAWDGPAPVFELLNSSGSPLNITPITGENFSQLLQFNSFFTGDYYARVRAQGGGVAYSLLLLRGAAFSVEPNASFESAQLLSGVQAVLGSVHVPPVDGVVENNLRIDETPLKAGFFSSGAFYYDQNNNNSNIGLRLNNIEYLGSGGGQFSTFTYCYGLGAARSCPVRQLATRTVATTPNYKQTISGEHYFIFDGRNDQIHLLRVVRWRRGETRLTITTQITNLGSGDLEGLQALESINPNPGGLANTNNDVISGRTARASNANGALAVGSQDPRAVAAVLAGDIADPALVFQNPVDPGGANSNDALHLAFDLGAPLPAGGRASYTYLMALGATAAEAVNTLQAGRPRDQVLGLDNLYAIDLQAGQRLVLQTLLPYRQNDATYLNGLDPLIRIYNPGRVLLAENDDCQDDPELHCTRLAPEAQLEFDVEADGRYYIQVTNSSKPGLFLPPMTMPARAGGEFVLLININQPPKLDPIADQQVMVGESVVVRVSATDPDLPNGDRLTYSLDPGAPEGAHIDPTSGFFEWTPGQPGEFTVTVVVEDRAWSTDSRSFTIRVEKEPDPVFSTCLPLIMKGD